MIDKLSRVRNSQWKVIVTILIGSARWVGRRWRIGSQNVLDAEDELLSLLLRLLLLLCVRFGLEVVAAFINVSINAVIKPFEWNLNQIESINNAIELKPHHINLTRISFTLRQVLISPCSKIFTVWHEFANLVGNVPMSRLAFASAVVAVFEHVVARWIQCPESTFTWTTSNIM